MQLVEAKRVDLDAPVQRYVPWFRVADEKASAEITVRHLLNHTSGLSTKTGRSFQGDGDTSDTALEQAVRKLDSAELTAPVGSKHQYSTVNYSVLGLIVRPSPDGRMRRASRRGPIRSDGNRTRRNGRPAAWLATGHNYGQLAEGADLPTTAACARRLPDLSAADMTHRHLSAQLRSA
jgi:hypothetical protein